MSVVASDLPQFVRDLLASSPKRGEGLNLWLFRTARVLHPYRSPSEIVQHWCVCATMASQWRR
jgi:hypothetical protein